MTLPRVLVIPSYYPSSESPVGGIFVKEQVEVLRSICDVAVLVPEVTIGWRRWWRGLAGPPSTVAMSDASFVLREQSILPSGRWPWASDRRYDKIVARGFARLVREWGVPDLLHAFVVLPAGLAAARLGRRQGIPVVITEVTGPFSVHMKTPRQKRLCEEALRCANAVVSVGPGLARELVEAAPGIAVRVIPPVIRTDRLTPAHGCNKSDASKTRFLSIGGLVAAKGFTHLLRAVRTMLDRGCPPFSVEIIGEGPERTRLEQQSTDFGIAGVVRMRGNVGQEELYRALQECDALVHPSLGETFGIVVAEAMALGKPVIATRCGGPEFVVAAESGVLVAPGDADALATAMGSIADGSAHFDGEKSRAQVVERFGPETFLKSLKAVYDSILSNRPADTDIATSVKSV